MFKIINTTNIFASIKLKLHNGGTGTVTDNRSDTKKQSFGAGAGVFGWSLSRHFSPAPATPYIFV